MNSFVQGDGACRVFLSTRFKENTIIFREHVPRTIGLFGQRGGRFYFLFSLHFFP